MYIRIKLFHYLHRTKFAVISFTICMWLQGGWQCINQTKPLNEQALLQAEKRVPPSFLSDWEKCFYRKTPRGNRRYSALQEGGGPKTLCSRETCPECKTQDLVKSGHRASFRGDVSSILGTSHGRTSGTTSALAGLPGFYSTSYRKYIARWACKHGPNTDAGGSTQVSVEVPLGPGVSH